MKEIHAGLPVSKSLGHTWGMMSKVFVWRARAMIASLAFTVEASDVRGTPFDGLQTLRLVTPCRLRGDYDKYTMLEYLVYRSYAVIAEPALRVRLVQVRFQDSEKSGKNHAGYAFFIEDIGEAAHGREGELEPLRSRRARGAEAC